MSLNKIAFVLGATEHGPMILSRLDYCQTGPNAAFGVGIELLENGEFDVGDIELILDHLPRKEGSIALDIGANIGVMTLAMSRYMRGWGRVISFEPQERIFYALAGNIAINNCWNAHAIHAAVTDKPGTILVPRLDYQKPASYGSLEMKRVTAEKIGQEPTGSYQVGAISVDSMNFSRVDFMKIDVEGMELDVLHGAEQTIEKFHPTMFIEHIKCGDAVLRGWLMKRGYNIEVHGNCFIAK